MGFFFPNYFVANIYLVDKDHSWATQSRQGLEAPHVLSQLKQEELPALEILLWLNSKQEICFKTTREFMWFWLLHSDQLKAEQEERKKEGRQNG